MKNIYNVLSDAFDAANLKEQDYATSVVRLSSRRIQITIVDNSVNQYCIVTIMLDNDGFVRSVNAGENTLLPRDGPAYVAFLDRIYEEEYIYM